MTLGAEFGSGVQGVTGQVSNQIESINLHLAAHAICNPWRGTALTNPGFARLPFKQRVSGSILLTSSART